MKGLVEYSELSPKVKERALMNVLVMEKEAISKNVLNRKSQSLHQKVNDKNSLKNILRQIELVNKLKSNREYFERVVKENLCHFTKEGFYYSYMQKRLIRNF